MVRQLDNPLKIRKTQKLDLNNMWFDYECYPEFPLYENEDDGE